MLWHLVWVRKQRVAPSVPIEDLQFAKEDFETLGIEDEAGFCGRVIEALQDPKNKLTEE
ncbi:MAG: hypothetical protein ACK5UC_27250 [Planctomycetaceae bacterium]